MFFDPVTKHSLSINQPETSQLQCVWMGWLAVLTLASCIERMVVRARSLDVRPIACSCKKSYDKVITRTILSHPRTTLACSRTPATYWRKTVRKILCVLLRAKVAFRCFRSCVLRTSIFLFATISTNCESPLTRLRVQFSKKGDGSPIRPRKDLQGLQVPGNITVFVIYSAC